MENLTNEYFNTYSYEKLLRKNLGLITTKSKIPVRDRKALSFVYTPGVGSCCKIIEANPNKALELTNKQNSVLIVTDSSGFDDCNQNNCCLAGFPYVEAFSFYYKTIANIDAYPIILDCKLVKSREDFQETIKAIMPAFSLVEFFAVDDSKLKDFDTDKKFAFIGGKDLKWKIEEKIKKSKNLLISSNLLYAGVIRAALDLNIYDDLNKCVDFVVNSLTDVLEKKHDLSK
jgi:hypothetical protein